MTGKGAMVFSGETVAQRYDEVLVPLLFEPWAELLVQSLSPEPDWNVLDLATGTGIVASKLATRLGPNGRLTAADLNADMLKIAKSRLAKVDGSAAVDFIETPAAPLDLPDAAVDAIYCQQGIQFFPDGAAAAAEMYRVLRPGGRVAISAWCPLRECEFFGTIAKCLREIGEEEAALVIGAPFEHMPRETLERCITDAGFSDVVIERVERDLEFSGGPEHAYQAIHATPLAPKLAEFSEETTADFRSRFLAEAEKRTKGGTTRAPMVSLVLTATR